MAAQSITRNTHLRLSHLHGTAALRTHGKAFSDRSLAAGQASFLKFYSIGTNWVQPPQFMADGWTLPDGYSFVLVEHCSPDGSYSKAMKVAVKGPGGAVNVSTIYCTE